MASADRRPGRPRRRPPPIRVERDRGDRGGRRRWRRRTHWQPRPTGGWTTEAGERCRARHPGGRSAHRRPRRRRPACRLPSAGPEPPSRCRGRRHLRARASRPTPDAAVRGPYGSVTPVAVATTAHGLRRHLAGRLHGPVAPPASERPSADWASLVGHAGESVHRSELGGGHRRHDRAGRRHRTRPHDEAARDGVREPGSACWPRSSASSPLDLADRRCHPGRPRRCSTSGSATRCRCTSATSSSGESSASAGCSF